MQKSVSSKAIATVGFILFVSSFISYLTTRIEAENDVSKPAAVIEMTTDLKFNPYTVQVKSGDTVEWVNKSPFSHTVTADPALDKEKNIVMLPQGAQPFHSGDIGPGQTFHYTFTVPGRYRYICVPHEEKSMIGEVVVRASR